MSLKVDLKRLGGYYFLSKFYIISRNVPAVIKKKGGGGVWGSDDPLDTPVPTVMNL